MKMFGFLKFSRILQVSRGFAARGSISSNSRTNSKSVQEIIDGMTSDNNYKLNQTFKTTKGKPLVKKENSEASIGVLETLSDEICDSLNDSLESPAFRSILKGTKAPHELMEFRTVKLNKDASEATAYWESEFYHKYFQFTKKKLPKVKADQYIEKVVKLINNSLARKESKFRSALIKSIDFRRVPRVYFRYYDPIEEGRKERVRQQRLSLNQVFNMSDEDIMTSQDFEENNNSTSSTSSFSSSSSSSSAGSGSSLNEEIERLLRSSGLPLASSAISNQPDIESNDYDSPSHQSSSSKQSVSSSSSNNTVSFSSPLGTGPSFDLPGGAGLAAIQGMRTLNLLQKGRNGKSKSQHRAELMAEEEEEEELEEGEDEFESKFVAHVEREQRRLLRREARGLDAEDAGEEGEFDLSDDEEGDEDDEDSDEEEDDEEEDDGTEEDEMGSRSSFPSNKGGRVPSPQSLSRTPSSSTSSPTSSRSRLVSPSRKNRDIPPKITNPSSHHIVTQQPRKETHTTRSTSTSHTTSTRNTFQRDQDEVGVVVEEEEEKEKVEKQERNTNDIQLLTERLMMRKKNVERSARRNRRAD